MKKLKAFTLIELLVVIAIIGLLATIVIFNFGNATVKAKRVALVENLNNAIKIGMACGMDGTGVNTPAQGDAICTDGSETWPKPPTGFDYTSSYIAATNSFNITFSTLPDGIAISCSSGSCQ